MSSSTKSLHLGYVADSPLAFDGNHYRYATGEWRYLERIAVLFDHVEVFTSIILVEENAPSTKANFANVLQVDNACIVPLLQGRWQAPPANNWLARQWQFFRILQRHSKQWDFAFFMMPSWPTFHAWIHSKFRPWSYAICARADWPGAARHRYPQNKRYRPALPFYLSLLYHIESRILRDATIRMTEGYSLADRYPNLADSIIPALTLELPLERFRERSNTCQAEPVRVVYVGSLEQRKGVDVSLRAIARLHQEGRSIEFHIAGTGPDQTMLQNLAEELKISHLVKFHGALESGTPILDFCYAGDIFLLNSYSEGFPRVLYEAMSQSLPVITTPVGSIPLLLKDEETALFIECDNVDQTAAALERVISEPALRSRLIRNGYQFAYHTFENDPIDQAIAAIRAAIDKLD